MTPDEWLSVNNDLEETAEECDECMGSGEHECDCGNTHECSACDGTGVSNDGTTFSEMYRTQLDNDYHIPISYLKRFIPEDDLIFIELKNNAEILRKKSYRWNPSKKGTA
jgi:hypothetical protein